MVFDWYEICNEEDKTLQQGDFVLECPIVIPPVILNEGDTLEMDVKKIDSIVLSQSCDLVQGKIDIVLVCPYYSLKNWLDASPYNQNKKTKKKGVDDLRKGHFPAYHLLNKLESDIDFLEDYQVVDFRNVYGVHFQLLNNMIENTADRIRLLPPYREHLSQAFARYFMRVGLPQDLVVEYEY